MITGPITDAERATVRALWREGVSAASIATEINRPRRRVRRWITALNQGRDIVSAVKPIDPETRAHIRTLDARGMRADAIARELGIPVEVARRGRKALRGSERRAAGPRRRVVAQRAGAPSGSEAERESCRRFAWFRELTRDWARGRPAGWWWA